MSDLNPVDYNEYHLFVKDLKHDFNFEIVVDNLNSLFEVSNRFPINIYEFYDLDVYRGTYYEEVSLSK